MPLKYNPITGDFDIVNHDGPPKIISFTCTDSNVLKDSLYRVSWSVEEADTVLLDGIGYGDNNSLSIVADHTGEITHILKAINDNDSIESRIKISVLESPEITFECSKPRLRHGKNETSILRWRINHYSSAKLINHGDTTEIADHGELSLSPQETENIKLVVIGLDGITSYEKAVSIEVLPESCVTFKAERNYTLPNVPVNLSWSVDNALSVQLVGDGNVDFIGNKDVSPMKTHQYVLRVEDFFGIQEYPLTISVLPIPVIKSLLVPTPSMNLTVNIETKIDALDITKPNIGKQLLTSSIASVKLMNVSNVIPSPKLIEINMPAKSSPKLLNILSGIPLIRKILNTLRQNGNN